MDAIASGTSNDRGAAALSSAPAPAFPAAIETLSSPEATQRRDSRRRRVLAGADVLALGAAAATVWLINPPDGTLTQRLVLAAWLPGWILLNKLLGLYDRDAHLIHKSTLDEIPMLALSAVLGTTLVFLFVPGVSQIEPARSTAVAYIGAVFAWLFVLRTAVRHSMLARTAPERCVIVGSGAVAGMLARKLALHPEYGVKLAGFVDAPYDSGDSDRDGDARFVTERLGDLDAFEAVCREHAVDRVVIAFSSISHERLIEIIRASKQLGLKISVVPRLFEVIGHQVEVDQLEGMTLLGLRGLGRTRSSLALKRAIDIAGSGLGIVLLSPFMLLVAAAVKLSSRGPVFYVQERVGRGNRAFRMLKFRTMIDGADGLKDQLVHLNEMDGPMFKIADDPRVTPIGRFLRRTSLDELPQLFNVLHGDMSLVGPRPLIPSEDVHVIGHHRDRLDLTPGLTGPWQVLGRQVIPFQEMIKLDYLYVAEWSLWNDVKLLLRTAPVVVQGRGQ